MAHELVKFDFHGNELDVVRDGDDVWISVRRVCEALGIAHEPQMRKLDGKPWARVITMITEAENKARREMSMMHLDALAMWLATIDADKVSPVARSKVIDFQCECARVLRDHFFPRTTPIIVAPTYPVDVELVHGPRIKDDLALCAEISDHAKMVARASGRSLQSVHGVMRRRYRTPSIYDVSRLFAAEMRSLMTDLGTGRLLLPPAKRRGPPVSGSQLRLVWPEPAAGA